MTAELGHVLRAAPGGIEGRVVDEPDDGWLAVYRADTPGGLPAVARDLLMNHPSAGFASIRDGDRCLAVARATVDGRWAGLTCVEVVPDERGRGLGAAVSALALRWAGAKGARHACLNVMVDNAPAIAVYERLGFRVHHEYCYRSEPDA
jgi:ribosomal protein S18 acetylase RimI-like enzyme